MITIMNKMISIPNYVANIICIKAYKNPKISYFGFVVATNDQNS